MCLFPPFMVRFLQARRIKQTYLVCFGLLAILNYVCAIATSVPVLLVACLLTGLVRIMVMLNCTFTIAPYLTGMDTLSMFTMKEAPSAEVQYALEWKRTFLMPALYLMLYSLVAAFGMKSLPSRYLATYVFLMIWMRNAIAPVIGSSIYSNWLNYQQQTEITRLVETANTENTPAVASLKGRITKQAAIVAMKNITGTTVLLILGTAGLCLLLPYHKGETT